MCVYKNIYVYCAQISILYIFGFSLDIYINISIYIYKKVSSSPHLSTVSTLCQISSWNRWHLTVGRSSQSHSGHDRFGKDVLRLFLLFLNVAFLDVCILCVYAYSCSYSCCSWSCCSYSCCLHLAGHDIMTWSWCWPLLSSCCEWSKLTSVAKVDHFAMTKQRMNQIAYKWLGENPSQSQSLWIKSFRSALKTVDTALARTCLVPKQKVIEPTLTGQVQRGVHFLARN